MATLQIILRTLFCFKTTEQGHDEVYAVVAGRHGDGTEFRYLKPEGGGDADNGNAWDMNDGGNLQDRWLRHVLYQGSLANGQTADIRVAFMESDNTDYSNGVAMAGELLISTGDPYAVAAGAITTLAGRLGLFKNGDDALGGFNVVVTNNNGTPAWTHGVARQNPRGTYRFNDPNDGSNPSGVDNGFYLDLRNLDGGDGQYDCYINVRLLP